ncbi:MAG: Rrf2 family transcriptional regulator [Ignavibacteriaceae bacterium]|nr:Rrf2 family transcriptional regulator [Ignavibacteriaceae bacterium]
MLRLSKKSEYALMAVKYMALNQNGKCITVKEIAGIYGISFQLLAKLMQKLVKNNIIISQQGTKGGYMLNKQTKDILLADVISAIEENYSLTDCIESEDPEDSCARANCCIIRDPLAKVQQKINRIFAETTIKQIL